MLKSHPYVSPLIIKRTQRLEPKLNSTQSSHDYVITGADDGACYNGDETVVSEGGNGSEVVRLKIYFDFLG